MGSSYSTAATMSSNLWCLFSILLPKLLGLRPSTFQKKSRTMVSTLPELPQDMLMVIFANLEIPDLIRAGSVCSSWHAAYTCLRNLGLYRQAQTPCLFYTSESAGENVGCLYSLVEQREYKITLPDPPIRSRFLIGSSNGWLITADARSELHLVNPITGEQVALPSVITIEQVKPIFRDSGTVDMYELSYYSGEKVYIDHDPEIHGPADLRKYCYYKAFVFPDPFTGSYIVVLIHHLNFQLSFARSGDDKWTWLPHNGRVRDCTYIDGLLYVVTSSGEIGAFDLAGSTVTKKVIVDKQNVGIFKSMYIIPAPWGDLLHVQRIVNFLEQEDEDGDPLECDPATRPLYVTKKILIYKVDMAAKVFVKIKSLPHHTLFLGHNCSVCLGAAEHPQLKANHAYFTDDFEEVMVAQDCTRDIGVMNLENGRRKKVMSQIWAKWPCPTWITPNLTKMNLSFSK